MIKEKKDFCGFADSGKKTFKEYTPQGSIKDLILFDVVFFGAWGFLIALCLITG